jgi:hypothetical protein
MRPETFGQTRQKSTRYSPDRRPRPVSRAARRGNIVDLLSRENNRRLCGLELWGFKLRCTWRCVRELEKFPIEFEQLRSNDRDRMSEFVNGNCALAKKGLAFPSKESVYVGARGPRMTGGHPSPRQSH